MRYRICASSDAQGNANIALSDVTESSVPLGHSRLDLRFPCRADKRVAEPSVA